MSSINQLISELAHSVQQADSVPVRKALKLSIIHTRNKLVRESFANHKYTDKILQQRYRISLIDVPDGDPYLTDAELINKITKIKRSANKVPKPTRLINNLPFLSVRTAGVENPVEIAYVKEAGSKFYKALPGFNPIITYDYINGYIYVNNINAEDYKKLGYIIIESPFETPELIGIETQEGIENFADDDEYFIPEDMVPDLKKLVLETFNGQIIRQTNEINDLNLVS